jgi:nucleotide-binding universal stress UspA family protein
VALFVLGRRGEAAEHTQRDLGRSVERVVRRLHRPILAVTEDFQAPKRALLAFDGGPVTRRGVEWLGASPLLKDLPLTLLMAGKARQSSKALSWAEKTLTAQGLAVTPALLPGDPERVIAQTVREQEIDLLIMGAYSHSPLRSLIFGSKTSDLLRSATIPALLLR